MKETSAYVAKMAAKGLTKPESLSMKAVRAICASALSQTEDDVLPPHEKLSAVKRRRIESYLHAVSDHVIGNAEVIYSNLRKILLS